MVVLVLLPVRCCAKRPCSPACLPPCLLVRVEVLVFSGVKALFTRLLACAYSRAPSCRCASGAVKLDVGGAAALLHLSALDRIGLWVPA
jgi:hypothetical protein